MQIAYQKFNLLLIGEFKTLLKCFKGSNLKYLT
jgi:hypothetical protein